MTFDMFRREKAVSGTILGIVISLILCMQGCAAAIVERDLEVRTLVMDSIVNNIESRRGQDILLERMSKEDLRELCLDLIQVTYVTRKNYYILLHILTDRGVPSTDPPEGWR